MVIHMSSTNTRGSNSQTANLGPRQVHFSDISPRPQWPWEEGHVDCKGKPLREKERKKGRKTEGKKDRRKERKQERKKERKS